MRTSLLLRVISINQRDREENETNRERERYQTESEKRTGIGEEAGGVDGGGRDEGFPCGFENIRVAEIVDLLEELASEGEEEGEG